MADQRPQPPMQACSQPRCAALEFTASQHRHHGGADRRRKWVAAERRAVLAGMQHPQDVAIGHHRGQRHHAAAQCLAEQVHVRHHIPVVAGEGSAGAGQARLDLVGDHQHIAGGAEFAHGRQIVVRWHDHAGLALDRLEQHRDGVLVDRVGHRVGVTERHRTKARRERAEATARRLVRRKADDADGPAVKVVVGDHDIGLARGNALDIGSPFARDLDRALDRFGAAVHRQHHVLVAQRRQRRAEPAERLGVEGPAHQCDEVQLGVRGRGDLGIAVPEIHRGVRGQAVQVAAPFDVDDPRPLGAGRHHRQRRVVVRRVVLIQCDRRRGHRVAVAGDRTLACPGWSRIQLECAAFHGPAALEQLGQVDPDRFETGVGQLLGEPDGGGRVHHCRPSDTALRPNA